MTTKGPATNKSVFKIRRRSDGLYSKGGSTPSFSKQGKTWTSKSALSGHLALIHEYDRYKHVHTSTIATVYADCEVIEYTVVVGSAMLVTDYEALRHV